MQLSWEEKILTDLTDALLFISCITNNFKNYKQSVPADLLTSEISSSGWINLLVALEVVSVAGLLVTVEGGLETVLLLALGLATVAVA